MKNVDFSENQIESLKDFLKATKKCMKGKKIEPSFLLYIISILPEEQDQNIFTKSNLILLRDTLPKKRRIRLDYLTRLLKKEVKS